MNPLAAILPVRLVRALLMTISTFLAGSLLSACDPQRAAKLEEGIATEADVRAQFGEPENVWTAPNGGRTLEYNRQPEGRTNYMITIGADGRMSSLRQVLNPFSFRQVVAGLTDQDVRRMLGKPAKVTPFSLKNETAWDWRYTDPDPPNAAMIFTVWFDASGRVVRSGSAPELREPEHR